MVNKDFLQKQTWHLSIDMKDDYEFVRKEHVELCFQE